MNEIEEQPIFNPLPDVRFTNKREILSAMLAGQIVPDALPLLAKAIQIMGKPLYGIETILFAQDLPDDFIYSTTPDGKGETITLGELEQIRRAGISTPPAILFYKDAAKIQ